MQVQYVLTLPPNLWVPSPVAVTGSLTLQLFHPVVQAWFTTRLGAPTDVQRVCWPAIYSGQHALISTPTGSGKTLSAFLTCIDHLLGQAIGGY